MSPEEVPQVVHGLLGRAVATAGHVSPRRGEVPGEPDTGHAKARTKPEELATAQTRRVATQESREMVPTDGVVLGREQDPPIKDQPHDRRSQPGSGLRALDLEDTTLFGEEEVPVGIWACPRRA